MLTREELKKFLTSFISFLSNQKSSRSTIKNYSSDLHRLIDRLPESTQIQDADFRQALESLKGEFSEASLRRFNYSLKSFLTYLKSSGYSFGVSSTNTVQNRSNTLNPSPAEDYANHLHAQGSPEPTIRHYTHDLYYFFSWFKPGLERLADIDLTLIKRVGVSDITRYVAFLKSKAVSDASINRYLYSLKSFFDFSREKVVYETNPVRNLSSKTVKESFWSRLRFKKPRWWHAYRGHPASAYVNWVALATLTLFIGLNVFNQFFVPQTLTLEKIREGLVLAATPPRILSFQGRLTNPSGTPVTTATDIVFRIWDQSSGGTEGDCSGFDEDCFWKSKTWSVTPDSNGIFSVQLGDTGQSDTVIPAALFSDYSELYLGVTIGVDAEATPRQRIASSSYALNSDSLDGIDSLSFLRSDTSDNFTSGTLTTDDGTTLTVNSTTIGIGNAVGDTITVNGTATFTTDTNFTLLGTENVAMTSDLAGTVDVISVIATPSASAGTTQGLFIQQANHGSNTNGLDVGIKIDNADTDLLLSDAISITNTGAFGNGYTNFLNTPSLDITGAGAITGATGITSSGTITFSSMITDANAVLYTTTGGVVTRVVETETGSECLLSGAGASGIPTWGSCTGSGVRLDQITAATTPDTNNDSLNNNISWDWSTLTTQRAFTLDSTATGLTTGGILALGSSTTAYNHGAAETGSLSTLTFKDTTSGAFASTTNGLLVSPTIDISAGAATKTINGISVNPTFTTCTTATCNVNGVNIANVTDAGNFNGTAINIGSGWDTSLNLTNSASQRALLLDARTTQTTIAGGGVGCNPNTSISSCSGVVDLNIDTATNGNVGLNIDFNAVLAGVAGRTSAQRISLSTTGTGTATSAGLEIIHSVASTIATASNGIYIDNRNTTIALSNGIQLTSQAGRINDGIEFSSGNFDNYINISAPTGHASTAITGLNIGDLSSAGGAVETAIKIGSGWDTGICFDCDGTYTPTGVDGGLQWGTDANLVNLYRSASNTLKTDDTVNLGAADYNTDANGVLYTTTAGVLTQVVETETGSQCLLSGAGASGVPVWGSCATAAQSPWLSDIDADGFDLKDLSNIEFRDTTGAPAGTVPAIFSDSAGTINLNVTTGDTFDISVNGTDEFNFSSTGLDFNSNNITELGTNLTATAGLTVGTGSNGVITLSPNGSGNVVVDGTTDAALGLDLTKSLGTCTLGCWGVLSRPEINTTETTVVAAVAGQVRINTGAVLSTSAAVEALGPFISAGTITDAVGFYAYSQGAGGVTNAYGVYLNPQSGASGNNIGICFECDGSYGTSTVANGIQWGTDSPAQLFRSAASTLSVGTTTGLTSTGALTVTGGSTLTLNSTTSSAVALDSGTTGTINIGTNANGKAINIGNSTANTSIGLTTGGTGDLTVTTGDDILLNPTDDVLTTFAAGTRFTLDAIANDNTENTTATGGVVQIQIDDAVADTASNIQQGLYIDFEVTNTADANPLTHRAMRIDFTNTEADAADTTYALSLNNVSTAGAAIDGLLSLENNDATADSVVAGIAFLAGAGGSPDFTTAIDLSAADSTVDLALDDGLTISQTSDNDLDLVENSLTLNADFGETVASTVVLSVNTSGQSLALSTTGGGAQVTSVSSAGTGVNAVDLNASAGGLEIDAVTQLSLDITGATAASNISVAANADAEDLTLETTGSAGDLFLNSADQITLNGASATSIILADFITDANAVLYTTTAGVVTRVVETETGSQCLLSGAGASGIPVWGACPGGGGSLQSAYNTATIGLIETNATDPLLFTETSGENHIVDILQITSNTPTTFTNTGDLLQLSLDADDANALSGHGLHIIVDASQVTGNPILIEDDGAVSLFAFSDNGNLAFGTPTSGAATTAISITDGDYTNALSIADNNITGTAFSILATSGDLTLTATTIIIPDSDTFRTNDVTSTGALSLVSAATTNINLNPGTTGDVVLTHGDASQLAVNATPTADTNQDSVKITLNPTITGSTNTLQGLVISQSDNANTGVYDSLLKLENLKTPETTTNGLFVEHNAASGTLSNGIQLTNTAGTFSTGINFTGTFTNLISATNFSVTNAGLGTFAGNVAVNGGTITSTTTLTLDATTNIILADLLTDANAVLYTTTAGVVTRVVETETGSQCLLSGAGASGIPVWGACPGGAFSGEVDDTTNDSLTFTSDDASPPAGTVDSIFRDNAGDLNLNVITGKTFNIQVNAVDEYNFSSTGLEFNSNNITGLGTSLTAAAGLTINTSSNGILTLAPNGTADLVFNPDADTNFQITATGVPATVGGGLLAVTNSGQPIVATGVNGIDLAFVTGDGASPTNNALNIAVTSGGTAPGDVVNGINLSLSGTAGTERAITIGTGWDRDIFFLTDSTHSIQVQDQDTPGANGSDLDIFGSIGNTTGAGGRIQLKAGAGGASANGGNIEIYTGEGGGTSGFGGNFILTTGNASAGTTGNININVGTSSSGNGTIFIGDAARTQSISIGNATGATGINLTTGTGGIIGSSTVATGNAFSLADTALTTGNLAALSFTSALAATGTTTGVQISPTIAGTAAANTYTTNSLDLAAIAGSCPATATCRNNAINIGSYVFADADQTSVAVNIADQFNATGTHYGICFDCDGTYSNSQPANGIQWGNDANLVNLYRSASNTLKTDDTVNLGAADYNTDANGVLYTTTAGVLTQVVETETGSQCLLSGAGASGVPVWGSCATAAQSPWLSDIDADGFDLNDLSNILFRETTGAPAGTDVALFRDNAGDLNLNVLTAKTFNVQVNGVDEYNFSSTTLDFNANTITDVGNITATAAINIASTGAGNDITINGADQFIVEDNAVFNTDIDAVLTSNENIVVTFDDDSAGAQNLFDLTYTDSVSNSANEQHLLKLAYSSNGEVASFNTATDSVLDINFNQDPGINQDWNAGIRIRAQDDTAGTNTLANGILFTADNGGAGNIIITDAIDASDIQITNALNVGANTITGAGYLVTSTASGLTLNSTSADLNVQTTTSGNIVLQPAGSGTTARVLIGAGNGGAGSTTPDLFGLDVKSDTGNPTGFDGAIYYNQFDDKFRCFQASAWSDCLTAGTASNALHLLTAATATNTISNANFQQNWNWGTLTTQTGLALGGPTTLTTGSVLNINTTTFVHGAAETGSAFSLAFSDTTSGAFASTSNGLLVSPTINITLGAATKIINALSIAPTFTACTTATACDVNALNVGNVTDSGNFASTALDIGTGWDEDIDFEDATPTIRLSAADNTATLSIVDTSSNNLLTFRDLSTNFGAALDAGAFINRNSYIGEEWSISRGTLSADTAGSVENSFGDSGGWGTYELSTTECEFFTTADIVNGTGRVTANAASNECMVMIDDAVNNIRGLISAGNLPVMLMKVRPSQADATSWIYAGAGDSTDALAGAPANFIGFTNAGGTTWTGYVISGEASGGTTSVTCTGATITTSQFALLKVEVTAHTDGGSANVNFYVDEDVSNGISWRSCGSATTENNIPNAQLAPQVHWQERSGGATSFLDIDFWRAWQDDSVAAPATVSTSSGPIAADFENKAALTQVYPTDELYLEPGTLVSLDNSATELKVKTSSKSYDRLLMGVTTDKVGLWLDNSTVDGVNVAIGGRAKVRVSTENGPVAVGDLITSSSTQGIGMKSTKAGYIIGRALTVYNGEGVGTVLVSVNTYYSSAPTINLDGLEPASSSAVATPSATSLISIDSDNNFVASISAGAKFVWRNSVGTVVASVNEVGEAVFNRVTALVGEFRRLIFGELVAKKDAKVAGEASFDAGATEVFIESDKVTEESLVNLTPITKTGGLSLYVKEKKAGVGFVVALERNNGDLPEQATASATQVIKFTWFILNQE